MNTKLKILIALSLLYSPRALSIGLNTKKDTICLTSVIIYSKSTKEQLSSFQYFRIRDDYFDATINYPFVGIECNEPHSSSLTDVLKAVKGKREKRLIKQFSKKHFRVWEDSDSADEILNCIRESFDNQLIMIKQIKIYSGYEIARCNLYPNAPSFRICPEIIKENGYIIPTSYDCWTLNDE